MTVLHFVLGKLDYSLGEQVKNSKAFAVWCTQLHNFSMINSPAAKRQTSRHGSPVNLSPEHFTQLSISIIQSAVVSVQL